ncbi:MAG TPA: ABC transporter substrate-binding protein [Gemmatimonadales bacterium]|jgi:putative spermidine/putrescine transport system substrate-binding protein/spermidine/putrescine transport system substrate-binding protein
MLPVLRMARGALALCVGATLLTSCGGDASKSKQGGAVQKIAIQPTSDARADATTYTKLLCPKPLGGELNFMVWEGYTDTLFTKPFEEACGVKVNATYMGSSDDLVAKLRAGGAETIDLISPSSDAVTAIIDAGLAQPLDLKRIPSYGDLMQSFRDLKVARKDTLVYGLPWAFGPNPLIYDTTKVKPAPKSWKELWDKKYKGKLSLQDDIATLYMVAQTLGLDDPSDPSKLYNLSDEDLAKVKAEMLKLVPNVRKYWVTAGDMTQLFQSGEILAGEGWPLMTNTLRTAGFPAGELIPEEGTTAWADHWVLTKGARNLDAAYAFLEYAAQPFTQKLMSDVTAYNVANPTARSYMAPEAAALQKDIADYGSRVNFWQWGSKRDKYQEIWNEVKSGK